MTIIKNYKEKKENEMVNEFTKQNLKSGMWIVTRNGLNFFVMLDYNTKNDIDIINVLGTDIRLGRDGICISGNSIDSVDYIDIGRYNNDLKLKHATSSCFDVMEVRKADSIVDTLNFSKARTIWKREEPKTLTQREHDFLNSLYLECWLARDKRGILSVYDEKINKKTEEWKYSYANCIELNCDLFTFIKWEDEESYSTEEMLEWEIKG